MQKPGALEPIQAIRPPPARTIVVSYDDLQNGTLRCRCCSQSHLLGQVTAEHVHFYCAKGKTHYLVEQPTRAVLARDSLQTLNRLLSIIESLPA